MVKEVMMSDNNIGWSLDIPRDPKQLASYSSSYVRKVPAMYTSTKNVFNTTPKRVSRKAKASLPSPTRSRK